MMVPIAPIVTGVSLVVTFRVKCISVVRSLYFRVFSTSFFIIVIVLLILIIIIIIVVVAVLVIPFMQGIYNYIPDTNHVSTVYSVAAVLYLQFVLHVM